MGGLCCGWPLLPGCVKRAGKCKMPTADMALARLCVVCVLMVDCCYPCGVPQWHLQNKGSRETLPEC